MRWVKCGASTSISCIAAWRRCMALAYVAGEAVSATES